MKEAQRETMMQNAAVLWSQLLQVGSSRKYCLSAPPTRPTKSSQLTQAGHLGVGPTSKLCNYCANTWPGTISKCLKVPETKAVLIFKGECVRMRVNKAIFIM